MDDSTTNSRPRGSQTPSHSRKANRKGDSQPHHTSPLALRIRVPPEPSNEQREPSVTDSESSDDEQYAPGIQDKVELDPNHEFTLSGESYSHNLPTKRPAADELPPRALKQRRGEINATYLKLYNEEIVDAATRSCHDGKTDLANSQLGLSRWTFWEKHVLFGAIQRLGRDDIEAIARRIETKSVVEVQEYMMLIEDEKKRLHQTALQDEDAEFRTRITHPAALELSQACCFALEEEADFLSIKQEEQQQRLEKVKWGDEYWKLTPDIVRQLERKKIKGAEIRVDGTKRDEGIPSIDFFHVPNWLKLSRHVFMNSSIPSDNWTQVDVTPPDIRTTTLGDFHALAVSVTQRLVQTIIFVAESRLGASSLLSTDPNMEVPAKTKRRPAREVSTSDVRKAISILKMPTDSKKFWRESARRNRLHVYDISPEEERKEDWESFKDPLTYDAVESLLSVGSKKKRRVEKEDGDTNGGNDETDDGDMDVDTESDGVLSDEDDAAIKQDVTELLFHSADDPPWTETEYLDMKRRMTVEQHQDQFDDLHDRFASWRTEADMWKVVDKAPPEGFPKRMHPPAITPDSFLNAEYIYPISHDSAQDWRTKTLRRGRWASTPKASRKT